MHQTNRPYWSPAKLPSGEPSLHAHCEWYVRNTGSDSISIVGAYAGDHREWHGIVETFLPSKPGELLVAIDKGKNADVAVDFWISPPPVSPDEPLSCIVTLQDDSDNFYPKRIRFDHDATPMRQLNTAMVTTLRRDLVQQNRKSTSPKNQ